MDVITPAKPFKFIAVDSETEPHLKREPETRKELAEAFGEMMEANHWFHNYESRFTCDLCDREHTSPMTYREFKGKNVCLMCERDLHQLFIGEDPFRDPDEPRGYYQKEKMPPGLRKAVFERDQYRCRYCGGYEGGLSCDHVQPELRGGKATLENLVTACKSCNSKKGSRTPSEAGMPLLPEP